MWERGRKSNSFAEKTLPFQAGQTFKAASVGKTCCDSPAICVLQRRKAVLRKSETFPLGVVASFSSLPVCCSHPQTSEMWWSSHPVKVRGGNVAPLRACFLSDDSLPFAFLCVSMCDLFFQQTVTFRLLPGPATAGMRVDGSNSEEPRFPVDWSAQSRPRSIGSELISRAKEIKCLRGLSTCDGEIKCEMTTQRDARGGRSHHGDLMAWGWSGENRSSVKLIWVSTQLFLRLFRRRGASKCEFLKLYITHIKFTHIK